MRQLLLETPLDPTRRDHVEYKVPAVLADWMRQSGAAPSATLMDTDGAIGRAFGARTTPHLYVLGPQGRVLYAGAIDDRPSANPADVKRATNLVNAALADTLAGRPVAVPASTAYGCSVKY